MAKKPVPEITSMSDQAIDWIILLHSGNATERDKSSLEQWRRRSPEHERAYVEAELLWRDMGDVLAADAEDHHDHVPIQTERDKPSRTIRRSRVIGLATAAILLILMTPFSRYRDQWLSDFHTDIGAQRAIVLADGSTVNLDTDSALSIHYGPHGRQIRLHRGQALFTVAADPLRPFEVITDSVKVRALGTVFAVREDAGQARVIVLEHAVSLKPSGSQRAVEEIRIREGQQAAYNRVTGLSRPVPVDAGQISAWRRGKLIFKNRPLAEVIAELERYLPGKILITDQAIGAMKVSGVFPVDEPGQALALIGKSLPIEITSLSPWLTVLHK